MGKRAEIYDPKKAKQVRDMSAWGCPQADIAKMFGFTLERLKKVYGKELDEGRFDADNKIRKTLVDEAVNAKNTSVLIFLAKTRLHMSETNRVEMVNPVKVVLFSDDEPAAEMENSDVRDE